MGTAAGRAGRAADDWKQRAAVVQSYRELAGVTDPAVAIGPPPARQAELSEAFAASVRALELPDDDAMVKAMGRGELEARVRQYARAEAAAPPDLSRQLDLADGARDHSRRQAQTARDAGNEELARSAETLAELMTEQGEKMRIAQAAREEWAEAHAGAAEAANQARAELGRRGPVRYDGTQAQSTPGLRGDRAVDPAQAGRWRAAQAELADLIRAENTLFPEAEAGREPLPDELGTWMDHRVAEMEQAVAQSVQADGGGIEWPAGELDGLDPEAVEVMAFTDAEADARFSENLARAQAAADELAAQRARNQAERDRAAIDEPVRYADTLIGLEAAATAEQDRRAEADSDAEMEI